MPGSGGPSSITSPEPDKSPETKGDPASSLADLVPRWAEIIVTLMDEAIPIPGTRWRIGLDAVLGFVLPGLGDAIAAGTAVALVVLGFGLRVPRIVLARMAVNVAVDALVGAIPIVGDVFDVGWKANRRNVALIRRFQRPNAEATLADYVTVWAILAVVLVVLALPILLLGWVLARLL